MVMEVQMIDVKPALPALVWTEEQRAMIRATYASGASDAEFAVLIDTAASRGLDPRFGQVHFVKRWNSQQRCEVWSIQPSIDGMRSIAESTGLYDGQDEPEFVDGEKGLVLCKVRVYRKDWSRPCVGVAYWSEYVQTTKDGAVTTFWKKMPHVMLAKCAEAIALRKAFPHKLAGMYAQEEMMQADNEEREEKPARGAKKLPPPATANTGAPALPSQTEKPPVEEQPQSTGIESIEALREELQKTNTLDEVCFAWMQRQADIHEEDTTPDGEGRGIAYKAMKVLGARLMALRIASSQTAADKLVKDRCYAINQQKQEFLEELKKCTSGEEAVEVYRTLGFALSVGPKGEKLPTRTFAHDAVCERCISLGTKPDEVVDWVNLRISRGAPKDDGPKGGKRPKPAAPPASAQGSAAEGAQGNGAQASVSYLVPNAESARYVASATEWEAHVRDYEKRAREKKSDPRILSCKSWAKHAAAFRAAGERIYEARLHTAAEGTMRFFGATDSDVVKIVLKTEERTAEANARKHAAAVATFRKTG